jgi:hypothetical protein
MKKNYFKMALLLTCLSFSVHARDKAPLNKTAAKKVIDNMNKTFKKIENVGSVKYDYCENCVEKKKMKGAPPPNVDGFRNRLLNLPKSSSRNCASGVRQSLNKLFNKNVGSGPDAKKYGPVILNQWTKGSGSCFAEAKDTGTPFSDFDVRVMTPKNISEAGHIEIYFEGTWYSDFKQRISLWNGGDSKYSSRILYRYSDCRAAHIRINMFEVLSNALISEACAADGPNKEVVDENTPFPAKEVLLAESGEWIIKDVYANQGSDYALFKKDAKTKKEIMVSKDSNSIHSLIHSITDKSLQEKLTADALKKWVTKEGKTEVQKRIMELEAMTTLQKDYYVKEGFKLPEKYTIYLK